MRSLENRGPMSYQPITNISADSSRGIPQRPLGMDRNATRLTNRPADPLRLNDGGERRTAATVTPMPPAEHSDHRLPDVELFEGDSRNSAESRSVLQASAAEPLRGPSANTGAEPDWKGLGELSERLFEGQGDKDEFFRTPDTTGRAGATPPPIDPPEPPAGGAAIPEEPDDAEGRRHLIIQTSTGPVDLDHLLRNSRAEGEAEIPTGVLRKGDMVVFEGKEGRDTGEKLAFNIQETEWRGLSMDETPTVRLTGRLHGSAVPPEDVETEVVFQGSGYGGESASRDIVTTDRGPYFRIAADGREFRAFGYGYVDTVRETESGLVAKTPNQLDIEARRSENPHNERLRQVEQLTNGLGYDIRSTSDEGVGITRSVHNDEQYEVEFLARGEGDNELTVVDRRSKQWIKVRYRDAHGEDILQIGVADLSGRDVGELFQGRDLGAADILSRAGVAITTFTTSNRYGLEAVNYYPSNQQARDDLGIPPYGAREEIDRPDIQIFPDGTINIPHTYPYSEAVEGNPGLEESIKSMISSEITPQGEMQISLGNRTIQLPNPRQLLNDLQSHIGFHEEQ